MIHWKGSMASAALMLGAAALAVPLAAGHGLTATPMAGTAALSSAVTQQTTQATASRAAPAASLTGAGAGQSASNASRASQDAAAAAGAAAAGSSAGNRTGGTYSTSCNDGTVSVTPSTIWPPNHKMVTVTITYADTDKDGDSTMITVMSISDNETVGGVELNGSGQPTAQQGPDWSGAGNTGSGSDPTSGSATPAQTTAQVRAERSGTGDGRTYDIKVTCTDSGGTDAGDPSEATMQSQTVDLYVTVPHDQGHNG